MGYRVDFGHDDDVIEMALPRGEMRAARGVDDDEQLRRLQDELRRISKKMQDTDEGDPRMAELKRRYRYLMKRLRELGADAPLRDSYPGDDLTEADVDALVADWTGAKGDPAVDLSEEQEKPQEEDRPGGGSYFGVEDLERIAREDTGGLSEEQKADAELHEELKRQVHAESFGEDDPDLSDEEMWDQLSRAWGLEDK